MSTFHEFSALISDSGSKCQPIHPDSKYTDVDPLYSCFVALQDVDESMGPTIFLPSTNNQDCQDRFQNDKTKNELFASCEYRQAMLRKGDVAIMDSRTLHCDGANVSSPPARRALLYFTLLNPAHSLTEEDKDYPMEVSGQTSICRVATFDEWLPLLTLQWI
jgi:ectoine hydroxylase-related dioxygenase (phytanoyl-CoA dioxygenase family)